MPRRTSIPNYSLHKSTGQARVRINGKDHYLGKYGSPESRAEYARLIAEHASVGYVATVETTDGRYPDISINELLVQAIKHSDSYYVQNGVPTGEASNIRYAVEPLRTLYGEMPARDFGPRALSACLQYLVDVRKLSRSSANARMRKIRLVFKWAVGWEMIPPSVHAALESVPGLRRGRTNAREMSPVTPVPDTVIEATLPFTAPVVADMIRVQRCTGMRPQDVCSLRRCDIDMDADIWIYRPEQHKNRYRDHDREIAIGPVAQSILKKYLGRESTQYLFSPAEAEAWRRENRPRQQNRSTPIFPCELKRRDMLKRTRARRVHQKEPGFRYNSNSYRHAIHYAIKKARKAGLQIEKWSPNRIRHTTGTEVRKRFGLEAAQVTLGNAHARVSEIYAERNLSLAKKVAKQTG